MIQKIILLLFILFLINYLTDNKLINYLKNKTNYCKKKCLLIYQSLNKSLDIKILDNETIINLIIFFKQYFKSNNIIIMNKLYYIENNNIKYFHNIILNNNNELYNIDFVINNNNIIINNIYNLSINNTIDNNNNDNGYNDDNDDIPSIISISD